jgi:hypothetical protein
MLKNHILINSNSKTHSSPNFKPKNNQTPFLPHTKLPTKTPFSTKKAPVPGCSLRGKQRKKGDGAFPVRAPQFLAQNAEGHKNENTKSQEGHFSLYKSAVIVRF